MPPSRTKTPTFAMPSSKTCPEMGLRTVFTVQKPKKATPIQPNFKVEVGEKGLLESRSPTFRIDSSEKDMRRTGFEDPEENCPGLETSATPANDISCHKRKNLDYPGLETSATPANDNSCLRKKYLHHPGLKRNTISSTKNS
ncbi:hypothetical protein TNCV_3027891 [Trichonephila clavipes]|nr:hypothetical protein TNCV_3027891 [Trichonephila clavipes]